MLEALALAAALAALAASLLALKLLKKTRAEIGDIYALVYGVKNNLAEELMEARREFPLLLEREFEKRDGTARFRPDMLITEALALHPRAGDVMRAYKMGNCSGCSISTTETLAQGAPGYGVDIDELIASLNSLLDPKRPANAPLPGPTNAPDPATVGVIASSSIPFVSS